MTNKEKRKAIHDYQFVVYTPQDKIYKHVESYLWEIAGHVYPYRDKEIDCSWFDLFKPPPPQKKRRR